MKQIIRSSLTFVAACMFSACSVTIEEQELIDLVLNYEKGIIAGVEIGDSEESIKAGHNSGWEIKTGGVNDNFDYQYRKQWDERENGLYVGFKLDAEGKVYDIDLRLCSKGSGNVLTARKFMFAVFEKFNGRTEFVPTSDNSWKYKNSMGDLIGVSCTNWGIESSKEPDEKVDIKIRKSNHALVD